MIHNFKKDNNIEIINNDFTIVHYNKLLKLAVNNYIIADYSSIPWGKKFILWRHDIDFSLNRGLRLAKLETKIGVKATYFINPHSEFYNIAETSQAKIIKKIINLGHNIGLHFDAAFYDKIGKNNIDNIIEQESNYIDWLFGQKPVAFSFHNPTSEHLLFEEDSYGGLINCYAKSFKKNIDYCSDSNGYWRFRRLYDVLKNTSTKQPLQVLTHPGWWQEKPIKPRERIIRSIFGRAEDCIKRYDKFLEINGRKNVK